MTRTRPLPDELGRAVLTLRRRRATSVDASEREALARPIARLEALLDELAAADELVVAASLPAAREALEDAVAAAWRAPFAGYLRALEAHFDALAAIDAALHTAPAALPSESGDAAAAHDASGPATDVATDLPTRPASALPPPARATDFASLKDEYAAWYAACELRPERRRDVAVCLRRLREGQAIYEQVGQALAIPWTFVGITHGLECSFNFKCHLHNGDPLKARTVHVPSGRPASCEPPFTWAQSASDALVYMGYDEVRDWSLPHMLYLFERYNGMGYRRRGVPTPYLWSFSTLYEKGKFVADGRFDAQAVSKQCGAALMLKELL